MKSTSAAEKYMSLLGRAENGAQDTVRAGIAPRPLPTHATPDVPFDVPFPEGTPPLAYVTRPPALVRPRVRAVISPQDSAPPPFREEGGPGVDGKGWSLTGALTLLLWRTASRLAPWLLNRRWFRAAVMRRAARHANSVGSNREEG